MLINLLLGSFTVFISMSIQVFAVVTLVRYAIRVLHARSHIAPTFKFDTYVISMVLLMLFAGHLMQIAIWAGIFIYLGEFSSFEIAFYHSAVNFASLGYGDIVMSDNWRLLGAVEASNGVLMFGLSAGTLFSVMQHLFARHRTHDE